MGSITMYEDKMKEKSAFSADLIREKLLEHSKNFKTSWVNLGQALYPVWKDKLFRAWNYEKFEDYTEEELGVKKSTALKLLKTYFFLEQSEPEYLKKEFPKERPAVNVPGCDEVNVLRLARGKKELTKDDYREIKESIFEKGRDASGARKDLVALMKQRKEVDPEQERQLRNEAAIRRLVNAMRSFKKDMDTLKLAPAQLIDEAEKLMEKLQEEIE